jgi:hypothetical protein
MGFRGQVSVEYVILLSALLLGVAFLGLYELDETRRGIEVSTAQDAVESLARAADTVYSMGPCSKTQVYITVPKGIVSVDHGGQTGGYYQGPYLVGIIADFGSGPTDIISPTKGQIQGYIPAIDRGYRMPVFQTCSGVIQIGQDLQLSSTEIRQTIAAGGSDSTDITLKNNRDITISEIESVETGIVGGWTEITGLATQLSSGGSDIFTIDVTVPGGTNPGVYSGWVIINGTGSIIELRQVITVT